MKKYTKRLQKKYTQRASKGLKNGNPSPFYMRRTQLFVQWYMDRHYLTVFRPWWYEEIENWKDLDFAEVHIKYYKQTFNDLGEKIGMDMNQFSEYLKSNPRPKKTNWKPRKVKPVQIRKLRNPQSFELSLSNGIKELVMGEVVFEREGYQFFIHRMGNDWHVSDAVFGKVLAWHEKYNRVVEMAKERMDKNITQYIDMVNKRLVS